jgi:cytochrome P450
MIQTGMTIEEIIPTFAIILIAGSETTATLLSAVTWHLCKNTSVMDKLTKEIRESFSGEGEINMTSVNKLKYLLAVLDEGMRIHPPVPVGSVRVTPPEGAIINGNFVPGRVQLFFY